MPVRGGWSFFASTARGDGTESLLAADLPLQGAKITTTVSGVDEISFNLTPEVARLQRPDGRPILRARSTVVYAVLDGVIRAAGLVRSCQPQGHDLSVTCLGFVSFLDDQPWMLRPVKFYDADPADIIRHVWVNAQKALRGDLGLEVSTAVKTKARVGKKVAEVKNKAGDVTTEGVDEPVLLAQYATHNLSELLGEMFDAGSIDYRERHYFHGDTVGHELVLGHPRLGSRRRDIAFRLGVNVDVIPTLTFDEEDYASEVLVLGAGEGDKMVRGHGFNHHITDRLRKVAVIQQKGIGRVDTANRSADIHAKRLSGDEGDVDEVSVVPHPMAPIGSWENGDEVHLSGDALWGGRLDQWVRVLSTTYEPAGRPGAVLKVVRADKV